MIHIESWQWRAGYLLLLESLPRWLFAQLVLWNLRLFQSGPCSPSLSEKSSLGKALPHAALGHFLQRRCDWPQGVSLAACSVCHELDFFNLVFPFSVPPGKYDSLVSVISFMFFLINICWFLRSFFSNSIKFRFCF